MSEDFIDHEIYFYVILLIDMACCIGITAIAGTGTTLVVFLAHVCGMLRIAW